MFFSCAFLSERRCKVFDKLPGDKFRAWELRYFDDCIVASEQRHGDTFVARWHSCFHAADIDMRDHLLETSHGEKLKRVWTTTQEAKAKKTQDTQKEQDTQTTKKPRLGPELPVANEADMSHVQLRVLADTAASRAMCSPESAAPSSKLSPLHPAATHVPAKPSQTLVQAPESTGLQRRLMPERCCSTVALLLMLQHSACSVRSKKRKSAHDCLITLLRHCLTSCNCEHIVHEACRLLDQTHMLLTDTGVPVASNWTELGELVLRLHGPVLGGLLKAVAFAIDDIIIPSLTLTDASTSGA